MPEVICLWKLPREILRGSSREAFFWCVSATCTSLPLSPLSFLLIAIPSLSIFLSPYICGVLKDTREVNGDKTQHINDFILFYLSMSLIHHRFREGHTVDYRHAKKGKEKRILDNLAQVMRDKRKKRC